MKIRWAIAALALGSMAVSPAEAGQLTLVWTDNADNEVGFKIERCLQTAPPAECTTWAQIATAAPLATPVFGGTVSWSNLGLTVGLSYCYRVRAYNIPGNSGYSNVACAMVATVMVPGDPANLSIVRP